MPLGVRKHVDLDTQCSDLENRSRRGRKVGQTRRFDADVVHRRLMRNGMAATMSKATSAILRWKPFYQNRYAPDHKLETKLPSQAEVRIELHQEVHLELQFGV